MVQGLLYAVGRRGPAGLIVNCPRIRVDMFLIRPDQGEFPLQVVPEGPGLPIVQDSPRQDGALLEPYARVVGAVPDVPVRDLYESPEVVKVTVSHAELHGAGRPLFE